MPQTSIQNATPIADIRLAVTSLADARRIANAIGSDAVLSLVDFDFPPQSVPQFGRSRHQILFFDDLEDAALRTAPGPDDIASIIRFFQGLPPGASVLVHCIGGRCRSTAAALIGAVIRLGGPDPSNIAKATAFLKAQCPLAIPNMLMASIADGILGAGGDLAAAADRIGQSRTISWLQELDA